MVLGARLYDPGIRRFTTADSFVASALDVALGSDPLTGNRYLFAGANPVAFYDNGHWGIPKIVKSMTKKALPALAVVPFVGPASRSSR